MKTQFHRLVLPKFYHLYCRAVLRSYSVSIYRFKRDNFPSENVVCESKTCIQNGQYFERRLDLTSCVCDVRQVERLVPPSLMKTQKIVEDNENSRGQKYTLWRRSGFNQVLIQVQLIQSLSFLTTTKKNKNTTTTKKKKIPYPFFNTGCPQGIPRKKKVSLLSSCFYFSSS